MFAFLLKVWGLARPYRVRLALGMVTGVISGALEPLMVLTIVFVFAVVFPEANPATLNKFLGVAPKFVLEWIQNARTALSQGTDAHQAAKYALVGLIPAVLFLRGVFGYLNVYLLQWVAVRAVADLRTKLFAHLLRLSAGFFSQNRSGDLISRIMSDTGTLQGILNNTTSVIIKDPVTVVVTVVGLFWYDWKLTLLSLVVLPVCVVPIAIFSRKVRKSSRAIQSQTSELTQVMTEAFTGHRVVKAYNLEDSVTDQFRTATRTFIAHYMRIVRAVETPGPLLEFFGAVGVAAIFLYLLSGDSSRRDFGSLLTFIVAIFTMYRPLKNITRLHNTLEQARAASERVFELLATPNSVPEPASPKTIAAARAEIHFDHVFFSYGEKPVLHGIELRVQPGQLIALVGASGSGKTTIANLLLRFYDPVRGAVRIGGTDIREAATRDLRNQIAVVAQENILFNDTIRRNIELGRPGASNEEIIAAARHANAHEFITEKPKGYDTVVGEKGVLLSGGQRQRLAIARAVLKDAPIL
ncbi:MAG: ABC transporter ATP-binding protein, partial [Verrucomicrobia bacterium]|nr:ABC transporter ATP-binding protein [Verrucomicrobiota bacterium]